MKCRRDRQYEHPVANKETARIARRQPPIGHAPPTQIFEKLKADINRKAARRRRAGWFGFDFWPQPIKPPFTESLKHLAKTARRNIQCQCRRVVTQPAFNHRLRGHDNNFTALENDGPPDFRQIQNGDLLAAR